MSKSSRRRTFRKLDELRPHPRQAELFSDLSEPELDALADDIERNGLQHPPEILSDGTIVAGHQRVRAARKLGHDEIEVVVRDDLEAQGPEAVERRLIEDNVNRRQLDGLEKARAIAALYDLHRPDPDPAKWRPQGDLRDLVGKRMGLSGREVSRYLAVVKCPAVVQEAYRHKKLSIELAAKVATLPDDARQEISDRITAGEKPRSVVQEFLAKSSNNHLDDTKRCGKFLEQLQSAMGSLPDDIQELPVTVVCRHTVELLEWAGNTCRDLHHRAEDALRHQPPPDPELLALLQHGGEADNAASSA